MPYNQDGREENGRYGADGPRPKFYMACGTEDGLIAPNRAYRDELLSLGYDVTWEETPGAHSWPFWDAQIERALSWLPLEEAVEGVSSGNVGESTI